MWWIFGPGSIMFPLSCQPDLVSSIVMSTCTLSTVKTGFFSQGSGCCRTVHSCDDTVQMIRGNLVGRWLSVWYIVYRTTLFELNMVTVSSGNIIFHSVFKSCGRNWNQHLERQENTGKIFGKRADLRAEIRTPDPAKEHECQPLERGVRRRTLTYLAHGNY
jgi:hypothetical protein